MIEITILIVMCWRGGGRTAVAGARREGTRERERGAGVGPRQLAGIGRRDSSGPAVLHFSADWCGPCAAVRRVVRRVTEELADAPRPPLDIGIDIDASRRWPRN